MPITRRLALSASAVLAAGAMIPRRLWAVTTLTAGDLRIDSVSDGTLELPAAFVTDALPDAERADIIARFAIPADRIVTPMNITLLRRGDRVALFDVGSGPGFMPTAGKLAGALAAVGITPADVTDVIFTHAHPDHLWGLLDEFDEPVFARARLQMGAAEHEYWTDPQTPATIGEARQAFAVGAARRLAAVGDRMALFEPDAEVLPGVTAVATPGHTPGHTSFAIGTPDTGIMVTGDAIGNATFAFARPDLPGGGDQDQPRAAESRKALLARLADENWRMIGYHLPGGGIGRCVRQGDAFAFVPEAG
ncbi:MBL fold metallo-hydrolase [Paracoccus luteus]|uniref:MBL fold metallo-hydrolase n=1 Tax=Paracoccus luteus TaxID=2508543 RepID=UPI00106FA844|nr:MBL fold metallo-hydrolase [Paracoccus luteus]